MIEIGSEYWTGCTPLDGNGVKPLLPTGMDIHYTLCGRTALELVLRDAVAERRIRKAYLPSYCCHTMIEPFVAKNIPVEFYPVFFTDTGISWEFRENNDCDLIFLMDYFGFRNESTRSLAARQRAMGKCVVYDATHAMFCKNMDYSACDYVFGSFRKWFGVNAGFCAKNGIWNEFPVLTSNNRYTEQRNAAFDRKREFMDGESMEKDEFLRAFSQAEESLETDYLGYGPDGASLQILEKVNVEYIRSKRRENAAFVIDEITALGKTVVVTPYKTLGSCDCPLFVPLQVDGAMRSQIRGELIAQRVYLPIHWPLSQLHRVDSVSGEIYALELSFVCDQRYNKQDMERAIEVIRSF